MTTTNAVTPITLGIYQYLSAQTEQRSPVMATAVIACVPSAVLLLAAQRFKAAGVTGGAVKRLCSRDEWPDTRVVVPVRRDACAHDLKGRGGRHTRGMVMASRSVRPSLPG